ncbi:hypothetical protein VOLCADRAFT_91772 [Volvox carteri f. nagariensis]|uniref:Uncharacterized protein n=1 Tax=Volvox carteri f. nagariensis TaxID=3068 RepID=D8TXX3_VOLCA|nr:uncharacterized protein VOLCADRAFT_91772 [Volvox carteri f. nagariensis]EFJ47796.1 hypothetical protein VOLCADRAFT_91772 [Volvox carteri f. nagariensis]|eukprot:XP_002951267.1 hypothetical protein VOLCADRAFT_91772 [Volvox carteri f. nagariensis]
MHEGSSTHDLCNTIQSLLVFRAGSPKSIEGLGWEIRMFDPEHGHTRRSVRHPSSLPTDPRQRSSNCGFHRYFQLRRLCLPNTTNILLVVLPVVLLLSVQMEAAGSSSPPPPPPMPPVPPCGPVTVLYHDGVPVSAIRTPILAADTGQEIRPAYVLQVMDTGNNAGFYFNGTANIVISWEQQDQYTMSFGLLSEAEFNATYNGNAGCVPPITSVNPMRYYGQVGNGTILTFPIFYTTRTDYSSLIQLCGPPTTFYSLVALSRLNDGSLAWAATDWVAANNATNPICPDTPTAWGYIKFGIGYCPCPAQPPPPSPPPPPPMPPAPSCGVVLTTSQGVPVSGIRAPFRSSWTGEELSPAFISVQPDPSIDSPIVALGLPSLVFEWQPDSTIGLYGNIFTEDQFQSMYSGSTGCRDISYGPGAITLPTTALPTIALTTIALTTIAFPTIALPTTALPTITLPTIALPTIALPTVAFPTIALPTVALATIALPTIALPTIALPTVALATIALPTIALPTIALPTVALPTIAFPTIALSTTALLTVALATIAFPTIALPTTALTTVALTTIAFPTIALSTTALPTIALPTIASPTIALPTIALPTEPSSSPTTQPVITISAATATTSSEAATAPAPPTTTSTPPFPAPFISAICTAISTTTISTTTRLTAAYLTPKSPKAPSPPKAPKAPSPPKAPKPPKVPKAPQLSPPTPFGGGNTFLVDNFPFFASCSVRDTNLRTPYRASTPTGPLNVTSTTATYCFHLVATNSSDSPCAGMNINRLEFIVSK